jgi:hypothetical protein
MHGVVGCAGGAPSAIPGRVDSGAEILVRDEQLEIVVDGEQRGRVVVFSYCHGREGDGVAGDAVADCKPLGRAAAAVDDDIIMILAAAVAVVSEDDDAVAPGHGLEAAKACRFRADGDGFG